MSPSCRRTNAKLALTTTEPHFPIALKIKDARLVGH
jgi:hypothetical protein